MSQNNLNSQEKEIYKSGNDNQDSERGASNYSEIPTAEANKILFNLIKSSFEKSKQKNGMNVLTLRADNSGIGHAFVIDSIVDRGGIPYFRLMEPHAGDPYKPTTWLYYKSIIDLKDNSLLISADEVANNYMNLVILGRTDERIALNNKIVDKSTATDTTILINQKINLETRPLISGQYQSVTDSIWKENNGKNIFLNREWLPIQPPSFGNKLSSQRTMDAVKYFNVDDPDNLRYKADGNWTYCNIFVSDVTRALGVEIPRWINGQKTTTDTMEQWLEGKMTNVSQNSQGPALGWKPITSQEAQQMANEGKPVVAIWNKEGWIGHTAMVIPGEGKTTNEVFYPTIAQAGGKNFVGKTANEGFYGDSKIKYFVNTSISGYAFVQTDKNTAMNTSGGLPASTLP